jgi:hypothetical protein
MEEMARPPALIDGIATATARAERLMESLQDLSRAAESVEKGALARESRP